ncbi:MAG: carboxymuconolactone decarboxylase family protein [Nitrospirae bacterium]|nr:carboxymuconolactone decarboxylase family protein [Nitrospirota bacterium]MCL5421700.1 carboxymuconolactone decarboxylase family protein [Nitrospirota bacterium]
MAKYPKNYVMIQKRFSELMKAHEDAGKRAKEAGPIDAKTANLIQLAACVALRSEGGVHSHARRALQAGASRDELYHSIVLLINTVGFPTIAAAFSWVNDIVGKKK